MARREAGGGVRKELGWDEQGSCIGNLTAYVAAVVVTESMRR